MNTHSQYWIRRLPSSGLCLIVPLMSRSPHQSAQVSSPLIISDCSWLMPPLPATAAVTGSHHHHHYHRRGCSQLWISHFHQYLFLSAPNNSCVRVTAVWTYYHYYHATWDLLQYTIHRPAAYCSLTLETWRRQEYILSDPGCYCRECSALCRY